MEWLPWVAAIFIALIIGGTVIAAVGARHGIKAEVKKQEIEALKAHTAVTADLAERLDAIDGRLAAIEKTLTDIP